MPSQTGTVVALALTCFAGLCEGLGIAFTFFDIARYGRRLRAFLTTGITHFLRASGTARVNGAAEISGQPSPLDVRVKQLEDWRSHHQGDHKAFEKKLRDDIADDIRAVVGDMEQEMLQRFDRLTALVVERMSRRQRYSGPVLIVLGVLAGTAAGVVAILK